MVVRYLPKVEAPVQFWYPALIGMKIRIIQGDITKVKADAIVNAANRTLLGGGGVDDAIHRAAGPQLLQECKKIRGCATGQAKITWAYNLPAKYVIHTVGPVWKGGNHNEEKLLASCYWQSLLLARQYKLSSVAFPAISTGAYGFPFEKAASVAINTVKKFGQQYEYPREVIFVLFTERDYEVYKKKLKI